MARKTNEKKTPEMIKKELQSSILEVVEEEHLNLNEGVKNAKEVKDL